MKKALQFACVLSLIAAGAHARPMSTMEWMDPKSFDIWKSLSAAEKTESIKAMMEQSGARKDDEQQFLLTKTQACVDREAGDADYQGAAVPLYIPWTFCMTKYSSILDGKAK